MNNDKAEIRKKMKDRATHYDLADYQRAGLKIVAAANLLLERLVKPKTVMSYVSMHNEPPTHEIIRNCLINGTKICVPWLNPESMTISASEVRNFTADLARGYRGILEPIQERRRSVDIEEIELHLVPGVAFDPKGGRLGHGAGCYDRFLALPEAGGLKVGLAFSWQLVGEAPVEEHDVRMDMVVTDQGIIAVRDGLLDFPGV